MAGEPARETKLRRSNKPVLESYDIIICDCPPNLTIPTQNALAISSHFAIPVSPDFLSGLGIGLLLSRIERLASDLEVKLTLAGVVISRVGRNAIHREEMMAAMREQLGTKVLSQQIKERVAVATAATQQRPIFDAGDAEAAGEFRAVCKDLLSRIGVTNENA